VSAYAEEEDEGFLPNKDVCRGQVQIPFMQLRRGEGQTLTVWCQGESLALIFYVPVKLDTAGPSSRSSQPFAGFP
jgi:hypothetical protein